MGETPYSVANQGFLCVTITFPGEGRSSYWTGALRHFHWNNGRDPRRCCCPARGFVHSRGGSGDLVSVYALEREHRWGNTARERFIEVVELHELLEGVTKLGH